MSAPAPGGGSVHTMEGFLESLLTRIDEFESFAKEVRSDIEARLRALRAASDPRVTEIVERYEAGHRPPPDAPDLLERRIAEWAEA